MHKLSTSHPLRPDDGGAGSLPGTLRIEHEEWQAEARRRGEIVVVSVTAPNPERALEQLASSSRPMDCWFKDGVRSLTGADLSSLFA
jgi:hypothetical protein